MFHYSFIQSRISLLTKQFCIQLIFVSVIILFFAQLLPPSWALVAFFVLISLPVDFNLIFHVCKHNLKFAITSPNFYFVVFANRPTHHQTKRTNSTWTSLSQRISFHFASFRCPCGSTKTFLHTIEMLHVNWRFLATSLHLSFSISLCRRWRTTLDNLLNWYGIIRCWYHS